MQLSLSILRRISLCGAIAVTGIANAPAQQTPAAPAPKTGAGKAAEPPSFEVVLTHAVPAGGECVRPDGAGSCRSLAHWHARITMPDVREPGVVPLTTPDELLRVFREAKKEPEEIQGSTGIPWAKNPIVIRAPSWAPYCAVQRVTQAAACSGLWKAEVSVAAPDGEPAAETPMAAPEEAAIVAPVLDDELRAKLAGPEPVRIALFCDVASGVCVRRIGTIELPCSPGGDRRLGAVLEATARERALRGSPLKLEIAAAAVVPWGHIVDSVVICQKNDFVAIEFVQPPGVRALLLQSEEPRKAAISGEGWRTLGLEDFVVVNGDADTWTEREGVIAGTGKPLGGARSKQQFTNFELVLEWKHHEVAGNSGVFVWCPEAAFTDLPRGKLPRSGIEVQVLDPGYEDQWLKDKGKRSDWFTGHGDVFPVGDATMQPFTPQITYELADGELATVGSAKSARCFPTKRLTKPAGEWNHYYIRAINGEVRVWVNGEEVSGGTKCHPARGYLALEAEGAPIDFRNLRLRELP